MQKKLSKATFGMGCFWGPELYFSKLDGIESTRVGYAGGSIKNPTYENIEDHSEVLEVTYDNSKISFTKLLEHFWAQHDSTKVNKNQYQSLILTHNQYQKELANASKNQMQKQLSRQITTQIRPLKKFYKAEDYHQKYLQKLEKDHITESKIE